MAEQTSNKPQSLHPKASSWHAPLMVAHTQASADRPSADRLVPSDRFVIAATVDRLIYGDEHVFQPDDARVLLASLPRRRVPWLEFGFASKMSGGSRRGFASGIGDVTIKDDKKRQVEYSTAADHYTRIGQWKLIWYGKRLSQHVEIEQVMADITADARGARITYALDGTPLSMDIRVNHALSLFWSSFVIVIPGWKPWKRPA